MAKAYLRNTDNQVYTPKKEEGRKSGRGAKSNFSLMRRPQPSSKGMSNVSIPNVRKEIDVLTQALNNICAI